MDTPLGGGGGGDCECTHETRTHARTHSYTDTLKLPLVYVGLCDGQHSGGQWVCTLCSCENAQLALKSGVREGNISKH